MASKIAKCMHLLQVHIIQTGSLFQYPVRCTFNIFIGANKTFVVEEKVIIG